MSELYVDGGCIKRNPSPIGGTWAWCLVEDDQMVVCRAGIIQANGTPISNNVAELTAALEGLEAMPDGWQGHLYSDSQLTLGRIFQNWPLNGVPPALVARLKLARSRLATRQRVAWTLLQGHPTNADLLAGVGKKRGYPVSQWNRWCDNECRKVASGVWNTLVGMTT